MIQETVLGFERHNVDYHFCIGALFGSLLLFARRCPDAGLSRHAQHWSKGCLSGAGAS